MGIVPLHCVSPAQCAKGALLSSEMDKHYYAVISVSLCDTHASLDMEYRIGKINAWLITTQT